ncbi:HlyD family type I secretion periplasmic adaptor subunit [Phyllobacterium lublinensis]|uniref:HlyD family type I secretion periplasmic adaptor subunit n=1 Tax=Phyllobacterium lublinensis TaxID=2875708 RepID=UPI001CCB510E|nr:HlyD family type I secretion periplasmic adaptor subunit [Phyllobacterium sp. 2063]MBZ9654896.1 HlyD family type I secretion periplasmic adaptor subunit [Phyllobacterium sp. 2063]
MNTTANAMVRQIAVVAAKPRMRPIYRLQRLAKRSWLAVHAAAKAACTALWNSAAGVTRGLRLSVIDPLYRSIAFAMSAIGTIVRRSCVALKHSLAITTTDLRLWLGGFGNGRRHRALATLAPADMTSNRLNHFPKNTFYSVGSIGNSQGAGPRRPKAVAKPGGTPFETLKLLAFSAFAVVAVFVVGFGTWASYAPLESAAIAGGAVEAETSRKTIQHLEGGIIGRILVNDGDEVSVGQPLIRLDDMRAQANVLALQMQLWEAQALEARLLAERDGRASIQFPRKSGPAAENDPRFAEIMAGQIKIFDARRNLQNSQINVIQQRKAQTEQEIAGLEFQAAAARERTSIIKDEVAGVAPLVAKGLQTKVRLLRLKREQAEIDGRVGDLQAQISRAQQAIGESQAMIFKLESDQNSEVAQSLRETQALISQLGERIQAATDILDRTVVRAPEAGTITDLRIHTPGGVIAAGEPLLDLVPRQDRLIVRALVKPEDIDLVRPGLEAHVRLLSYKHRRVPPVDGVLTYVSADSLVDKETERAYYTARVRIDEASLRNLPEVEMMPGMPVEVMIKTGEFTVAHYMLRPVLDSFNRAFRED